MSEKIHFHLIRCNRKSIALHIKNAGEVVVRAPYFVPKSQIAAFVQSHASWVCEKRTELMRQWKNKRDFSITESDQLTVLGKQYPVVYGERACFNGTIFIIPEGSFEQIKSEIIEEYKRIAKKVILERTIHFSEITGLKAEAVKIGNAKTRWGSCSGKNILHFTWKLIFADLYAVDYVVLHELAHIKEHNHSKRFWSIVADYMPDYKARKQHLLQVQKKIAKENWD